MLVETETLLSVTRITYCAFQTKYRTLERTVWCIFQLPRLPLALLPRSQQYRTFRQQLTRTMDS